MYHRSHRSLSQLLIGLASLYCLLVPRPTWCMAGNTPEPSPSALPPSAQSTEQTPNRPAQKGAEFAATKPAPRIDPKPRIIELVGGKVMFLGVDAEGGGLWRDAKGFDSWRTPGVIHSVHETFDKDLVMPVKAESCRDGRPAKPAGFRVEAGYMIFDDGKFLMVGTIYREDGSAETPLVLTRGDTVPQNRTSVVPLMRGKSALLLLNRSGQLPIFAGVYDSSDLITSSASKQAGSEARPDGFQATTWVRMAAGGWLCFAPTYRVDGSVDPPHTLKCEGGEIENQTQVVDLWGGASALVLADPKTKTPLLKGIYPNDQLHPSSAGILLTERYLSLEREILSLDTVYGPANPARFVGARLGDRPIQNRGQMIELAGNRSAVFTADPHSTEGVPRFAGIQDTKVCPPVR